MASWPSKSKSSLYTELCYIREGVVPSAFRLRRCTTLLTPSSAGQLGRKLREWGVYKYDSKNRPSDTALRLYRDGSDEAFGQPIPQVAPEDLSILNDLPVHAPFTPDLSTAHTEPLQDTNIEHYMNYAGEVKALPDSDEAHSTFNELLEPTEYVDADLAYTTLHNPSPAAIAVSNNPTTSMSTPQHVRAHEEDAASSVPTIALVTEEPENGRLSDIDMDRFSSLSLTPSVSSGFASLRSLAQRILLRQREKSSLRGDSLDDLPSSVMDWNRSNSSLQLFGRRSLRSSIASSQMTNGSRMSYTMLSNGSQYRDAPKEKLQYVSQQPRDLLQRQASPLVDYAESVNQYSPILTKKIPPPAHACVACNIPFRNKSSLSKHRTLHCERRKEWVCLLCVPCKNFDCKEKLYQHHINHHGEACIQGCRQHRDLLCTEDIAWSISHLLPKKAWGCPCCRQCFNTFTAWAKHSANHPLQNGKVIGWSLNTMVQSLILQPYLTDAIAYLPLHMFDPAKANADVCQNLREALERHKLPDAVQYHYDYRYLQLPEALAQYAFRLVAYGVPFDVPYDVPYPDVSFITGESVAKAIAE
jgi:hypothetical protein